MSAAEKIKGYRTLSEMDLALINEGKELAIKIGAYCDRLAAINTTDKRWVSIGTTQLQQGFMALTRAVARPESF